jgi:hypothetical protein
MACLDVQTSWHFRFHKPLLRRMRMVIGIRKPVSGSLCRLSVPLLLGPHVDMIDPFVRTRPGRQRFTGFADQLFERLIHADAGAAWIVGAAVSASISLS